jgi:3-isopropylmalate dehydrogenase
VYQTGHGAAYDIAGTGMANPVGQILSLAMMLEESFGWAAGARLVRKSVARTLARGVRTADIRGSHGAVSCREMSDAICGEIVRLVEAVA